MDKGFSAATKERESSFFNKHSEVSKMNHQALAIDWIDNPFQNLHPRLFNKQRKVANKRKKDPSTTSHSLSELNLAQDCSHSRFASLVEAEHWSRGEMKRANSVKSRLAREPFDDDGLTHPGQRATSFPGSLILHPRKMRDPGNEVGRRGRVTQTEPLDQPFFFPPLDMRPCNEKTALRRHNSSGVSVPTTQRGNRDTAVALSKRSSFQERRVDRPQLNYPTSFPGSLLFPETRKGVGRGETLGTRLLDRLDSQESLLSAYSSCLSLSQDVKAGKAPPKTGSLKGYSSPFVIGTRASNPNLYVDDFYEDDDTGNHYKNPRHHLISSSPTLVKRQANTSQRELEGEVIVKPKLHRSYSGHRKWSGDSAKRFYGDRDF